jgi:hypothetical protein
MFDPHDPESCNRYRMAYGEAARLLEIARFDHAWGRDFAQGVSPDADELVAAVVKAMARPGREVDLELIRLAVDDAVSKRQPRW